MQNHENKRGFGEKTPAGYTRSCCAGSAEEEGGLNVGI